MDRLLDVLVVTGRGERDAVFEEIKLAVGLGDDQLAVRRVGAGDDSVLRVLQAGGEGVQIGQEEHRDEDAGQG